MATLKPSEITRRNFISRAGMLMSALGITGGIQSGLMDGIIRKATKKWGGDALAAQPGAVRYFIEICARAGWQTNSLFASAGHKYEAPNTNLNFFSTPANVLVNKSSPSSREAFIVQYSATQGGARLNTVLNTINAATPDRVGVASTQVLDLVTANHTANFASRAPNSNAPCPAILHTSVAPAAAVQGVNWDNGNGVTNQRGPLPDLARVSDRTQFQGLFKDVPMYFTLPELKLIVSEIEKGSIMSSGAIDELDKIFLAKEVPGSQDVRAVSVAGRGQAQLSLLASLDGTYNTHAAKFGPTINTPQGGTAMGAAMNSALSAFAHQATTTMVITANFGDWHGDIQALGDFNNMTSKQGLLNTNMGNAIAGLLEAAAAEPDPHEPTKKILDSLLISLTSEFDRTPNMNGNRVDNGDGGTGAVVYIGSKVKHGALGNIKGSGATEGFDVITGNTAAAAFPSEMTAWKTTGKLLGIQDGTLNTYMPGMGPMAAMVKP